MFSFTEDGYKDSNRPKNLRQICDKSENATAQENPRSKRPGPEFETLHQHDEGIDGLPDWGISDIHDKGSVINPRIPVFSGIGTGIWNCFKNLGFGIHFLNLGFKN